MVVLSLLFFGVFVNSIGMLAGVTVPATRRLQLAQAPAHASQSVTTFNALTLAKIETELTTST